MVIEHPLETGQSRRIVYCKKNDLIDNNDGTYSFKNLSTEALGFGSKVFVIDDNKELLFDNKTGILYN